MQARTIRTIDTRNFRCAPPPCFAKLVFLAGMHSPPINRYEHLPLPMSFLFNALQKGLCRCRCARLCAIDHEEEDIAPNTVGRPHETTVNSAGLSPYAQARVKLTQPSRA